VPVFGEAWTTSSGSLRVQVILVDLPTPAQQLLLLVSVVDTVARNLLTGQGPVPLGA
jgi:hypothetical protein